LVGRAGKERRGLAGGSLWVGEVSLGEGEECAGGGIGRSVGPDQEGPPLKFRPADGDGVQWGRFGFRGPRRQDRDSHALRGEFGQQPCASRRRVTPTYASWFNQVERWFALLTDKKLRRGAHRSIQALQNDIRDRITNSNVNPKPFTWTKTADEILERLAS
jgi:hypothetical protein